MNRTLSVFVLVIIVLLMLNFVQVAFAISKLEGYELAAQNSHLRLFIDPTTTEIAIEKIDTGTIWFSNPRDRDTTESILRGNARTLLSAQFSLVYYTPSNARRELNNFRDSVALEQYQITKLDHGVKIDYTLGKEWEPSDYIPVIISEQRFYQYLVNPQTDGAELLLKHYQPLMLKPVTADHERAVIAGIDQEQLFGNYAITIPGQELTIDQERDLTTLVIDQVIRNRSDKSQRSQLQPDQIRQLVETMKSEPVMVLRSGISQWDREDMALMIKEVGYSPQDVRLDHQMASLDPPQPNEIVFNVPLEYRLDGTNLVVSIPCNEVSYPTSILDSDGNRVSYPLHSISLLEFFSAADQTDTGYIFVPDGSGALIDLNNKKLYAQPYHAPVYGFDYALERTWDNTSTREQLHLPVYGIKRNDQALFAVIESGAALARIKADIAGRTNSYNTIFPEFTIIPMGSISLPGQHWSYRSAFQARKYQGDIRIRYSFLEADQASYVGMAREYQKYLVENNGLRKIESDQVPLLLELIGGVGLQKPILGVPRLVVEPLTNISQIAKVIKELQAQEILDIKLRYSGWLAGGLRHAYPYRVKIEPKLGSEADFHKLTHFLREQGVDFYPDVTLLNAYGDKFASIRDAACFLDRQIARIYDHEISEDEYQQGLGSYRYIVSMKRLDSILNNFVNHYGRLNLDQLSLKYMGHQLNSDFSADPAKLVDREQARAMIADQLRFLREQKGYALLVEGGNSYLLPFVDCIVNMPNTSGNHLLFDRDVPFFQLVIHGYISYAGAPINLSHDPEMAVLKTIETGGSAYFKLGYNDAAIVKESEFNYLTSISYHDWLDTMVQFFDQINSALRSVQDQVIIGHDNLLPGVFQTTYQNGVRVIVNYNQDRVLVNDVTVAGRSFAVIGGDHYDD